MSIGLVFVDGPYGMHKYPGDEIETSESEALYRSVFARAALDQAAHLLICGTFGSLAWIRAFVPPAFEYRTDIVWHKPDWVGGATSNIKTFAPRHELLLHYSQSNASFNADAVRTPYGTRASAGVQKKSGRAHGWVPNALGARRGTVWAITSDRLAEKVQGRTQPNKHACVKPKELLRVCVIACTNELETVHEPFVGSQNLAEVCAAANRVYVGWSDAREYAAGHGHV